MELNHHLIEQEILRNKIESAFNTFSKELIDDLVKISKTATFNEHEVLVRKGQQHKYTFLVLSGLLKLHREDTEGNEFYLYHIKPGEACALSMMCMVKSASSEITATAEADTEVLLIPLFNSEQLMKKHSDWNNFIISTYRTRFEDLLETIDNIMFKSMDERLLFYLKRQQETYKSNMIKLTHQQIAQDLSSSREVISRLLKKMEQMGMITVHRNLIELIAS